MNVTARLVCSKLEWHITRSQDVLLYTIQKLWRCYEQQGNTWGRPRSGHLHVTSQTQDNHIQLTHLLNRFRVATFDSKTHPWVESNQCQDSLQLFIGAQHQAEAPSYTSYSAMTGGRSWWLWLEICGCLMLQGWDHKTTCSRSFKVNVVPSCCSKTLLALMSHV